MKALHRRFRVYRATAVLVPAILMPQAAVMASAPTAEPPPSTPYRWSNAAIVGGGFVTGVICHPTEEDVVYARTDMGGGYRLDPADLSWIPVTDFFTDYMETGIASVGLDPRDPDRVYFASGTDASAGAPMGTLLRSADRGATWKRIPLPVKLGGNWPGRSIGERLAVDPNDGRVLFLGTRLDGLWRSQDHGSTWKKVRSFPDFPVKGNWEGGAGVAIVFFDPGSGEDGTPTPVVYAAVSEPGVTALYRSKDAGAHWSALEGQPKDLVPHHVALAGNGILYVAYSDRVGPNGVADGAVWKLDTSTGTWSDITPVKPGADGEGAFGYAGLAVDAGDPDTVVVSSLCRWSSGDELWRSTDAGKTWRPFGQAASYDASAAPYQGRGPGHWIGGVTIDPHHPDRLWHVTGSGIWRTDNLTAVDHGGKARFAVGAVGLEQTAIQDLVSPPAGAPLISAMSDLGGFRHEDLAASPPTGNFDNPRVSAVLSLDFAAGNPDMVVRGGQRSWGGNGPFAAWSEDNGSNWTPLEAPPGAEPPCDWISISADGKTIVMSARGVTPHWTRGRGETWTPCDGLPAAARMVVADREDADVFYALVAPGRGAGERAGQVYRSRDGGETFRLAGRLEGLTRSGKMRALPGGTGHLWVPGFDAGLFRSTNGGETFDRVEGFDVAETVGFGKAAPGRDHPAVYVTGSIDPAYGVFRSDDAGASWVRLNDDRHQYGNLCFATTGDPRVYGRVYVGTNGRGIVVGEPMRRTAR